MGKLSSRWGALNFDFREFEKMPDYQVDRLRYEMEVLTQIWIVPCLLTNSLAQRCQKNEVNLWSDKMTESEDETYQTAPTQ